MAGTFRVLYVDDEPGLLEIGKLYLEREGILSVDTLMSAETALEQLNLEHYDAIISDYQMPEMDGITFLKQLKASGNTTPFIIFTGRGREEVVIEALNNGADFYLQKGGEPRSQFVELSNKICYAIRHRQVEQALGESERKYRELVENANSIILKWDKSGNISFFNEYAQRFFGYSKDEIIGKPVMGTIVPVIESGSNRDISLLINDIIQHPEDHIQNENENMTHDGKRVWIHWHNKPLLDGKGEFCGLLSIGTDISARKHMELQLRESEEKFRSLVEYAFEGIMILDFQGKILFANNAMAFVTESDSPAGLNGRNVMEFIAPESQPDVVKDFINVSGGHDAYLAHYNAISAKGRKISVESIGKVIRYEGEPAILISIRDISARKQAKDVLHKGEDRASPSSPGPG